MTTPLQDLLALPEKWREKQRLALIESTTSQIFRAGALGVCADELSALLLKALAEARLEEARWWAAEMVDYDNPGVEITVNKRIASLEAEAKP